MNFAELLQLVGSEGVFKTGQILSGQPSPADIRRQLDRWAKSGRIAQLRRGVYMLNEPYSGKHPHPFAVANMMKKASYISLQSALAHYGMIPEYVPVATSVTTGRPEELDTPAGRFIYRHVHPRMFFGFSSEEIAPQQYALTASPQKALVDLLYLTPHSDSSAYLQELRCSRPDDFDDAALLHTAEQSGSAKVLRAVRRLMALWEERET